MPGETGYPPFVDPAAGLGLTEPWQPPPEWFEPPPAPLPGDPPEAALPALQPPESGPGRVAPPLGAAQVSGLPGAAPSGPPPGHLQQLPANLTTNVDPAAPGPGAGLDPNSLQLLSAPIPGPPTGDLLFPPLAAGAPAGPPVPGPFGVMQPAAPAPAQRPPAPVPPVNENAQAAALAQDPERLAMEQVDADTAAAQYQTTGEAKALREDATTMATNNATRERRLAVANKRLLEYDAEGQKIAETQVDSSRYWAVRGTGEIRKSRPRNACAS